MSGANDVVRCEQMSRVFVLPARRDPRDDAAALRRHAHQLAVVAREEPTTRNIHAAIDAYEVAADSAEQAGMATLAGDLNACAEAWTRRLQAKYHPRRTVVRQIGGLDVEFERHSRTRGWSSRIWSRRRSAGWLPGPSAATLDEAIADVRALLRAAR